MKKFTNLNRTPKFHKNFIKARFINVVLKCLVKQLSKIVTAGSKPNSVR